MGKDTDGPLKPNAPDVDALGYVADAASEMATWSAMIIPVRQGAGTRVKIADAFSRKCPVISTHLGAYGYDVQSGHELLLADKPDDFAHSCVSLVRDRVAASAMADAACIKLIQDPLSASKMADRAYCEFLENGLGTRLLLASGPRRRMLSDSRARPHKTILYARTSNIWNQEPLAATPGAVCPVRLHSGFGAIACAASRSGRMHGLVMIAFWKHPIPISFRSATEL